MSSRQLRRATWSCFLFAGLVLILTAALEQRACADTLDGLVIGSAVADLGTTEWALSQPGLHEANPLLQGPPERAMAKTLGTAAILYGTDYLEKRGHKGWSKWIRIGAIVLGSGCAVNNALRARGAR